MDIGQWLSLPPPAKLPVEVGAAAVFEQWAVAPPSPAPLTVEVEVVYVAGGLLQLCPCGDGRGTLDCGRWLPDAPPPAWGA